LLQVALHDVSMAGKSDSKIEYAKLSGDGISNPPGGNAACADRFPAFPPAYAPALAAAHAQ
jgi:hypothetical protein